MEHQFDENTISVYSFLQNTQPDFIRKCNDLFNSDIDKFEKNLNSLYVSLPSKKLSEIFTDEQLTCDESILTLYAISCIYNYLINLYQSISLVPKNELRKFILLKKRDYKKAVLAGSFTSSELYNKRSEENALQWLSDNEKINLTEFAFFKFLSPKTQICHTLKMIEYFICFRTDDNNTFIFPEDEAFYLYSANKYEGKPPLVEINQKQKTMNFHYDVEKEPGHFIRYYVAQDVPLLDDNEYDSETGTLVPKSQKAKEIFDYLKTRMPNADDQNVHTLTYNMMNYDACDKGYLTVNIEEDFVNKLIPEEFFKASSVVLSNKKKTIRQQVIDSINKTSKMRIVEFFVDDNGSSTLSQSFEASFMFTEAIWLDDKMETARLYLSKHAIEVWKAKRNNEVLRFDYERISNRTAKQILFFLQGERIKSRNNNYYAAIALTQFRKYFPSQSSDRNYRQLIFDALSDLMISDILIQTVEKNASGFVLQFIPLSDFEKEKYNLS